MNPAVQVDRLPSIGLGAKVTNVTGIIYLSQLYGSFNKQFERVQDIPESIADFHCPRCQKAFPVCKICDCRAPVIELHLEVGGKIKICSRNGCKHHALEFENANDAFLLFQSQDKSYLA
jgi:hypothetical protein